MQINCSKLKGKIVERNFTQAVVADDINVHRSTFYRKMMEDNGGTFTLRDIWNIMEVLKLTDEEMRQIFFSQESHKCDS